MSYENHDLSCSKLLVTQTSNGLGKRSLACQIPAKVYFDIKQFLHFKQNTSNIEDMSANLKETFNYFSDGKGLQVLCGLNIFGKTKFRVSFWSIDCQYVNRFKSKFQCQ